MYYAHSEIELLNTPKSEKIDKLCQAYLGFESSFSSQWTAVSTHALNSFVEKRCDIAHKGRKASYVKIKELKNDKEMINTLVVECDALLLDYLTNLHPQKKQPWKNTY